MMNISAKVGHECTRLGLWPEAITEYVEYINKHIHYVQEFGALFSVPDELLFVHDESKWSVEEFPHYCQKFYGGGGNDDEFAVAWLHHENANPHHWGHWVARTGSHTGLALPMPEVYVREMVADWHGAEMAQSGTADISDWLDKAGPKMNLHDSTVIMVHAMMKGIGYVCTDNRPFSFSLSRDSTLRLSKAVKDYREVS